MKPYHLLFIAAIVAFAGCAKIETAFDASANKTKVEVYENVAVTVTTSNPAKMYTVDWDNVGVESFTTLPVPLTHYYSVAGIYNAKITANCQDEGLKKCSYENYNRIVTIEVVARAKKYEGTYSAQTTLDFSNCPGNDTVINTTVTLAYTTGEQLRLGNLFGVNDSHTFNVQYPPYVNPTETDGINLFPVTINGVMLTPVYAAVAPLPPSTYSITTLQLSGQYMVSGSSCTVSFASSLQKQ